jgi:saccharopine dehydrogenase-like NADP-dependent oxidoreductase
MTIRTVAVLGLGKVGTLVGTLLKRAGFETLGLDLAPPTGLPFKSEVIDLTDAAALAKKLPTVDAVISCLPFSLNMKVSSVAHQVGVHYFDLTEDVGTTKHIIDLSTTSKKAMIPQCGLAPGIIGILGASLAREFDGPLRSIEMRVGALPQHPRGVLGYAFNWSPEGVVNEYIKECEIIRSGKKTVIPPLEDCEALVINGVQLEAFTTSGGLGTMCDTYEGQVKSLDYKSIRYPGHCSLMRFFLFELHMDQHPDQAVKILANAKPPVLEDVVYLHAAAEGTHGGRMLRREFVRAYRPLEIEGKMWTAISWTTAASAVSVIEMVASGALPNKGFVKQEDIPLDLFLATKSGSLYTDPAAIF